MQGHLGRPQGTISGKSRVGDGLSVATMLSRAVAVFRHGVPTPIGAASL